MYLLITGDIILINSLNIFVKLINGFNPLQPIVAFLHPFFSGDMEKQQRAVMG